MTLRRLNNGVSCEIEIMSMQDFVEAMRFVVANPDEGFFAGPREPALVAAAESAIGSAFPPSYREFVQRLGAGSFGAFEVYGVTNANFDNGKVPNGIWLTLKNRRSGAFPNDLLVIGATGDGSYYCLELRHGQEGPVVVCEPGAGAQSEQRELVAEDFGEFFLKKVRDRL